MTCIQPDTLGQKSQLPAIIMVINSLLEIFYSYESDVAQMQQYISSKVPSTSPSHLEAIAGFSDCL